MCDQLSKVYDSEIAKYLCIITGVMVSLMTAYLSLIENATTPPTRNVLSSEVVVEPG